MRHPNHVCQPYRSLRQIYLTNDTISLAFLASMILSMCRICDKYYTRNTEIQHMLDEREELLKMEFKEQELQSRNTSTAPTLNIASPVTPVVSTPYATHDEEAAIDPMAIGFVSNQSSRTVAGPSSANYSMPSSSRYAGPSLAAVSEASRYQSLHSAGASSSTDPIASIPAESAFLLSSSEVHANLAMVADGSRYTPGQVIDQSQLPPYSPGNQRMMPGHGDESNDIRLSEYVKGETRAQDMKDSGGF